MYNAPNMGRLEQKHLPLRLFLLAGIVTSCTSVKAEQDPRPPPQIIVTHSPTEESTEPTPLPPATATPAYSGGGALYSCVDVNQDALCSPTDDPMLPNVVFELLVENEAGRIEAWIKTNDEGRHLLPDLEGISVPYADPLIQRYGESFCLDDITYAPQTISLIYEVCPSLPPGPEYHA